MAHRTASVVAATSVIIFMAFLISNPVALGTAGISTPMAVIRYHGSRRGAIAFTALVILCRGTQSFSITGSCQ